MALGALQSVAGMLPNVRAVFVYRDPKDLAYRQYFQHYQQGNVQASTLSGAVKYNEWYHEAMDRLAEVLPATSMKVTYDEIVTEPELIVARIRDLVNIGAQKKPYPDAADDRGFGANFGKA